jgi:cell wall-associated NlpC family hydrolase
VRMNRRYHRVVAKLASALVVAASLVGLGLAVTGPPAGAATGAASSRTTGASATGQRILAAAASQVHVANCTGGGGYFGPTQAGGCSAPGFGCMSLSQYAVYHGTGGSVALPGNGTQLPGVGQVIPPHPGPQTEGNLIVGLEPGDVTYWGGSLGAYQHSGIYAGNGMIWDAVGDFPVGLHSFAQLLSPVAPFGYTYDGAIRYSSSGHSSIPPGYDLVGSDGGVFVFGGGFHGSLPGLGIRVNDITGIVPTARDNGYFLVGSDGGVFAFNAPFANSLPGIGVHVDDIVGIVPTLSDNGYFLVGRDGGVFSFNAPFEDSLPGMGIHVDDIVGIAATADDRGYWLVGSDGSVYAFGDAHAYGNGPAGAVAITATHDGGGYWVVGADGSVRAFGDAHRFGDLPSLGVQVDDIVGIVVSPDSQGYNLIGRDGGIFTFGDAVNEGSLPGLGVHVDNVVGAVPT